MTGGAGFIGSHVAEELLKRGHEVICLDNFDDYYSPVLKESNVAILSRYDNFRLARGSILDKDLVDRLMVDIDYVFHNAAQAGVDASIRNPQKTNEVNVIGGFNVLDAARKCGIKKLINASSSSVYGQITDLPQREDLPTRPISPYGVSKLCFEDYCEVYRSIYDLDTVSLRYFTVFGPRMRPDLAISIFTSNAIAGKEIKIFGDGNKTRDFTYIENIVDANLRAMERGHGVYNIGGGDEITIRMLAESIICLTGSKSSIVFDESRPGDMEHTLADISKAKQELEYIPGTSVREGLKKYVEYVSSNI
ncbi:NAD-dependent epimerase/dehydratase family protein [Methanocella sp. MCL-LM]|uniref:NAD-dependent epimerase/dehydratase family protein n=1 Tax=Methanocella sp. MCL-LM TaxID=3412035 RepID=UPI003C786A83